MRAVHTPTPAALAPLRRFGSRPRTLRPKGPRLCRSQGSGPVRALTRCSLAHRLGRHAAVTQGDERRHAEPRGATEGATSGTTSGATATAAQAVAATVWYERAVVVTLGRGALWGAMLLAALQQLDGLHHAVCNGGLQWGHKPASYLHIFISARTYVCELVRSQRPQRRNPRALSFIYWIF